MYSTYGILDSSHNLIKVIKARSLKEARSTALRTAWQCDAKFITLFDANYNFTEIQPITP